MTWTYILVYLLGLSVKINDHTTSSSVTQFNPTRTMIHSSQCTNKTTTQPSVVLLLSPKINLDYFVMEFITNFIVVILLRLYHIKDRHQWSAAILEKR